VSKLPIISGRALVRAWGATGSLPASVSVCTMILGTGGQAARGTWPSPPE